MRPLIVDLGRDYRGGQHQALLLLQGFARARPRSGIDRGARFPAGSPREGCRHFRSRRCPRHAGGLPPRWHIRRLVRGESVDVVHANEPHALSSAWLARAHRSVPVVASRRIALPLSPGSFSLARYRAAARIVAVSHFVEQSVIASGLPAGSIDVIYDGVEIPPESFAARIAKTRAADFGISPETLCIGNVAAFVPEKGHALLVRAFAELRNIATELRKPSRASSRMHLASPRRRPGASQRCKNWRGNFKFSTR